MALKKDTISATINLELKPWIAPSFATRALGDSGDSIPVRELDHSTLEAMALAWLRDLYAKAGKVCPFSEIPAADSDPAHGPGARLVRG